MTLMCVMVLNLSRSKVLGVAHTYRPVLFKLGITLLGGVSHAVVEVSSLAYREISKSVPGYRTKGTGCSQHEMDCDRTVLCRQRSISPPNDNLFEDPRSSVLCGELT